MGIVQTKTIPRNLLKVVVCSFTVIFQVLYEGKSEVSYEVPKYHDKLCLFYSVSCMEQTTPTDVMFLSNKLSICACSKFITTEGRSSPVNSLPRNRSL